MNGSNKHTHGIIAVGPNGDVLHFRGYTEEPSTPEWEILDAELGSGILSDQEYQLYAADPEVVKMHNERQTTR